jgi:hypothetical protein
MCLILNATVQAQAEATEEDEGPSAMEAIFDQKYGLMIDSALAESVALPSRQLNAIMEEYFTIEKSKEGEITYRPKMITIEYMTPVVTETNAGVDTKIEMVSVNVQIPAVSLANISLMEVQEVEVEDGAFEMKLVKSQGLPQGFQRLLDMLNQSIRPF